MIDCIRALTPQHISEVLRAVQGSFEELQSKLSSEWDGRPGGFFCLATETGEPLLVALIGQIPPAKWAKYFSLSMEKARRLAIYPKHATSFESRDEEREMYGGAVRVGSAIYSFSGLPELHDEALMFDSALRLFPGHPQLYQAIALRENEVFARFSERISA